MKKLEETTEETIRRASEYADKTGIGYAVIASNTGSTIERALGKFENIIWVTHHSGMVKPGELEFDEEVRIRMRSLGIPVLTTGHALSGVERGLSTVFQGYGPVEIMAATLRLFGNGTKVAVEVATMALDAGLIPYNEKIIAIGGTGRGADTALVITPAYSKSILRTRIHEVICKTEN